MSIHPFPFNYPIPQFFFHQLPLMQQPFFPEMAILPQPYQIIPQAPEFKNIVPGFHCEKCNKFFSTNGNLKNHILAIHENKRPFHCTFSGCDKSYSNKSRLIVHERTHTGVRPFICHLCHKSFNEKGNLKTHMGFHLNQRPFICYECNKSYKTNGHLKDHIEIHHLKIKKFVCDICHTHFGRGSTLKSHMRTHTGERNHKCLVEGCNKNFSEKGNMKKHYLRHLKRMEHGILENEVKNILENIKSQDVNAENNINKTPETNTSSCFGNDKENQGVEKKEKNEKNL